jgi:hypothetical protein
VRIEKHAAESNLRGLLTEDNYKLESQLCMVLRADNVVQVNQQRETAWYH